MYFINCFYINKDLSVCFLFCLQSWDRLQKIVFQNKKEVILYVWRCKQVSVTNSLHRWASLTQYLTALIALNVNR